MKLYDTHCHLQDERLAPDLEHVMRRAEEAGVTRLCCCGSSPADWPAVAACAARFPAVRPAFGLHPWHLAERAPDWADALRTVLLAHPGAPVGEIGLDHAIAAPGRAEQETLFRAQLELAAELGRPVSLHVRQAWGAALACLRGLGRRPPALIFHAYSGGPERLPEILALGGFISFSGSLTRPGNRRGPAAAAAVPADRLLLESDAPDLPPVQAAASAPNEPAFMVHTLAALAAARGWSLEQAAEQTWLNAGRAFGG